MGGHYDADINWFRFAHEPSYILRLGPKYDFFDEFKSLREQFSEQAVAKGDFSVCLHGGWKDERAYERVLNFFLSTRAIFKNDEDWGPDFGLRKERQGFLFPDTPIQNPVYIRERIDGYYRASLFPPAALNSPKVPFEDILGIKEDESTMRVIETVARIVRDCRERNHWLAFLVADDC